ncbi:YitT family protein [Bacillus sp. SCS-153A]|uniref:YitT family protein n=1 Tax=Rossellomorea sedimentorum TaxID=3115294 RepID=UPI0039062A83
MLRPQLHKAFILGVAAAIQGVAMSVFLFPHYIPSGGAASMGVLLNYLFDVPYAVTLWTLNAGLLLIAARWLGSNSVLWTLYCVTITSFIIRWITTIVVSPVSYIFTDLFMGAVIFGIGLGILFRMGASSGGMDILALILSKVKGLPPGKCLFWINGTLLLLTGLVVDWLIIIYALVCQYIGTRIVDAIYHFQGGTIRKERSV